MSEAKCGIINPWIPLYPVCKQQGRGPPKWLDCLLPGSHPVIKLPHNTIFRLEVDYRTYPGFAITR
jgi:hypothetical protein